MEKTCKATEITAGFHPKGFRIDKTTSPMNIYTKWHVNINGRWIDPKPVCFDSLPKDGWRRVEAFKWDINDSTKIK